jgi:Mg-chelatase subunit ChlI
MHHKHVVYPFAAIVGQEKMKLALLLNAVDWRIGGVLIRGAKGTAKSTAARALAALLPEIEAVADCPFGCHPRDLRQMCKSCQERSKEAELPALRRKMRVVDLPINATEDRVVGTLDIEKALREGIRALEPGILAEANRGVLYIDEVNLLDDHIADLLLDAAAMGVNTVEREGISVYHPSRFILVGTMNPEEGELRPQLIDRFGLSVGVERIEDVALRRRIVEYREEFDRDPWAFERRLEKEHEDLASGIERTRETLGRVGFPDGLIDRVIETCVELGVDGHRADIVTVKAAKAIAALDGRSAVTEDDVRLALELALEHRMRRQPFEPMELDRDKIEELLRSPPRREETDRKKANGAATAAPRSPGKTSSASAPR